MQYPLTIFLIVATCITTFYAWNNHDLAARWIMHPYTANKRKEYWRLLTSGFLHAMEQPRGYMHLGFNMYVLYGFGRHIEGLFTNLYGKELGALAYLGLYLLAIAVSSVPSLLRHKDNPSYSSLGASGGVSAIVFAFVLLAPTAKLGLLFIPIYTPGFILGIIYLIYSYVMAQRGGGRIGHDAHFFGALFGVIFMIIVYPGVLDDWFINGPYGFANWDFSFFSFGRSY